ncbi:MAG TPA: hypothetical protein VLI92_01530 [Candidatus Saccharimonadales bacterium]|nr:hypothetical protein [Candidatus Saccharimonadales bacterium]
MIPNRETREGMSITFWMSVTVIAVIALATFISLVAYPYILNKQREAVQHSQQYVTSQVTALTTLKAQYDVLETKKVEQAGNADVVAAYNAQESAIIGQMWETYNLIPEDVRSQVVPQNIRTFLSSHPR